MFESTVNEYLETTPCKDWTIIAVLEHTASKFELSIDTFQILKGDFYSVLLSISESKSLHIHQNAKNKAKKILTGFNGSFSSADVKHFIDKLELKNERREFHTTVCRNVTVASTLQALKVSCKANLRIKLKHAKILQSILNRNIVRARQKSKISAMQNLLPLPVI